MRFKTLKALLDAVERGEVPRTHVDVLIDNDFAQARVFPVPASVASENDWDASEIVWEINGDPSIALCTLLKDLGLHAHFA